MAAVVSESVTGGNAMASRAQYQFGIPVPRNDRGNIDAGLGKMDTGGRGGGGRFAPADTIEQPIETRTIDGVTMK